MHFAYEAIPLDVYFLYLEVLHMCNKWILYFSNMNVREERVNATLGVNPQYFYLMSKSIHNGVLSESGAFEQRLTSLYY